jgi:hypothetical protein
LSQGSALSDDSFGRGLLRSLRSSPSSNMHGSGLVLRSQNLAPYDGFYDRGLLRSLRAAPAEDFYESAPFIRFHWDIYETSKAPSDDQ